MVERSTVTIRVNREVYEAFIKVCMDVFHVRPHRGLNVIYEGLMRFIAENSGYLKHEMEVIKNIQGQNLKIEIENENEQKHEVPKRDWSFLKQLSTEELIKKFKWLKENNPAGAEYIFMAYELKQRGMDTRTL